MIHFSSSPSKRQKSHHAETSINPEVHGWRFFLPRVRLSRVQSGSCSLPDYLPPAGPSCEGRTRRSRQVAQTLCIKQHQRNTNSTSPALFAPGCFKTNWKLGPQTITSQFFKSRFGFYRFWCSGLISLSRLLQPTAAHRLHVCNTGTNTPI